jgi:aspartate kinase
MSIPASETNASNVSFERERGVYALQITRDVAHAVISVGDDLQRSSRILQVFRVLADADVPVFLIKMHRTAVTLAFSGADLVDAEQSLARAGLKAETRRDLALIAVRATSMRDLHGVMVEIADAVYTAGARLYEIGDSHNSVQCLIQADRVPQAVAALQQTFHLDPNEVSESHVAAEEVG